jgi:nucleotide-binding universal stress UspA family protein
MSQAPANESRFFASTSASPGPFQRILVAIDGSYDAGRAMRFAAQLAQFCNARLSVVHVVNDTDGLPAQFAWLGSASEHQYRDLGRKRLELLTADLPADLAVERVLRVGDPAEEILEVARTWKADVIVTGNPAHAHLGHFLHRGVDDELLPKAPCSLLVIGPQT